MHYTGNDGYADTKTCTYVGEIGDRGEENTIYSLKQEGNTKIELWTHFYADYMMGDAQYDYFDGESFKPMIYYYDSEETEYHDEKTLAEQGVKLVSFEYPTPIENSFVFSHISYFSGAIVLPTLLIALLSMVAIIIFVRKDKALTYKTIDIVSIIFNVIICFTLVPFVSIAAMLIDINGGGPELYRQVLYFLPSFSVLCIAVSVALRRKGYAVKSLIAQFAGPAVFIVYLIVCGVLGRL